MMPRAMTAALLILLVAGPAAAQTTTPSSEKQETSCNTSAASTSGGGGGQVRSNSMAMEKSAILPSAGGHANSAAPTVQSGGKPMEVRPGCPLDTKPK